MQAKTTNAKLYIIQDKWYQLPIQNCMYKWSS